jgi:hypothetical protein
MNIFGRVFKISFVAFPGNDLRKPPPQDDLSVRGADEVKDGNLYKWSSICIGICNILRNTSYYFVLCKHASLVRNRAFSCDGTLRFPGQNRQPSLSKTKLSQSKLSNHFRNHSKELSHPKALREVILHKIYLR